MTEGYVVKTCGRPTRSGQPCKVRVYGSEVACKLHITEREREVAEAYQRGRNDGYAQARKSNEDLERMHVERLERRIRELEQRLDEADRYYEYDGDQVVEVGKYAYRWSGSPPLSVGDRVLLPENWLSQLKDGPGPQEGSVTKLGATYRGRLASIVRRL
jgi:hypothetical protein